jgi:hypothetical protein
MNVIIFIKRLYTQGLKKLTDETIFSFLYDYRAIHV